MLLLILALCGACTLLTACGGGGRLRLGTARPPRPVSAARPQTVHVLDLRAADQLSIGDRYLELGYNFRAKREYMRVIEQFPGSPETAAAQYRIGTCYLREEMYPEALEQFRLFAGNFPRHTLAGEARRQVERLEARQPPPAPAVKTAATAGTFAVGGGGHTAGLAEARARQEAAERALAEARARQEAAERALTEARARQEATEKALAEQQARSASSEQPDRQAEQARKLAAVERRLTEERGAADQRLAQAEQQRRQAEARAADAERQRGRAEAGRSEAERLRQAAEQRAVEIEKQRAELEQRLAVAEQRVGDAARKLAAANGTSDGEKKLTALLDRERQERQAAMQRATEAERQRLTAEQRATAAEARLKNFQSERRSAQDLAEKVEQQGRNQAEREAAAAGRRAEKAEQRAAEAEQRAQEAEARARSEAEARAAAEGQARKAAEARALAESEARQAAEARVRAEAQARKEAEARVAAEAARARRGGDRAASARRTVAAQVLHLPSQTLAEVEARLIEMKAAGINTVILRVFHNPGDRHYGFVSSRVKQGVYFKTDRAPVVEDALGQVLPLARKHGLELWAWMTTRYATYGLNLEPDWRAAKYDFETGKVIPAKGLNLFHPRVQEHLAGLFRDLARYPIDGVLFQDDLVLRHTEGMSEEARGAFQREMGRPLDPRELYEGVYLSDNGRYYVSRYTEQFWDWAAWKNRKLLQLAERLMTASRGARPELRFGINLMYEAVVNPRNALAWLSQSVAQSRKVGFDLYSVMAYHRQMQQELGLNPKETGHLMAKLGREAVRMVGDPSQVLIKVQSRDWKTGQRVPADELQQMLARGLEAGPVSLAVVPCAGAQDLVALREVLGGIGP